MYRHILQYLKSISLIKTIEPFIRKPFLNGALRSPPENVFLCQSEIENGHHSNFFLYIDQ